MIQKENNQVSNFKQVAQILYLFVVIMLRIFPSMVARLRHVRAGKHRRMDDNSNH